MWWVALIVIGAFALLIGVLVLINQSLAAGIKKNVVEADARAKSRGSVRGDGVRYGTLILACGLGQGAF